MHIRVNVCLNTVLGVWHEAQCLLCQRATVSCGGGGGEICCDAVMVILCMIGTTFVAIVFCVVGRCG
jgi:hypothetical protein